MFNQKSEDNKSQETELNFSKYAHIYDKHAQLQKLMADKLASFIPINTPEKILEIGCGTGIFTKYLLSLKVKKIFVILFIKPKILSIILIIILISHYFLITIKSNFLFKRKCK